MLKGAKQGATYQSAQGQGWITIPADMILNFGILLILLLKFNHASSLFKPYPNTELLGTPKHLEIEIVEVYL